MSKKNEPAAEEVLQPDVPQDYDSLKAEYDKLKTELAVTLEINKSLSDEIERLSKAAPDAVNAAPASATGHIGLSFTLDGVVCGFNFNKTKMEGKPITAQDVCASEELQRKLIEMKHGMIKFLA
ncbi:MAG TPA: hypothetical protein PL045_11955 [Chitinophagaceae bacterium]|nr:hypothetical protein [Chitinophagaceae bacterium]